MSDINEINEFITEHLKNTTGMFDDDYFASIRCGEDYHKAKDAYRFLSDVIKYGECNETDLYLGIKQRINVGKLYVDHSGKYRSCNEDIMACLNSFYERNPKFRFMVFEICGDIIRYNQDTDSKGVVQAFQLMDKMLMEHPDERTKRLAAQCFDLATRPSRDGNFFDTEASEIPNEIKKMLPKFAKLCNDYLQCNQVEDLEKIRAEGRRSKETMLNMRHYREKSKHLQIENSNNPRIENAMEKIFKEKKCEFNSQHPNLIEDIFSINNAEKSLELCKDAITYGEGAERLGEVLYCVHHIPSHNCDRDNKASLFEDVVACYEAIYLKEPKAASLVSDYCGEMIKYSGDSKVAVKALQLMDKIAKEHPDTIIEERVVRDFRFATTPDHAGRFFDTKYLEYTDSGRELLQRFNRLCKKYPSGDVSQNGASYSINRT